MQDDTRTYTNKTLPPHKRTNEVPSRYLAPLLPRAHLRSFPNQERLPSHSPILLHPPPPPLPPTLPSLGHHAIPKERSPSSREFDEDTSAITRVVEARVEAADKGGEGEGCEDEREGEGGGGFESAVGGTEGKGGGGGARGGGGRGSGGGEGWGGGGLARGEEREESRGE